MKLKCNCCDGIYKGFQTPKILQDFMQKHKNDADFEIENKVKVLSQVVDASKLHNNNVSIDEMVQTIQSNNIELNYKGTT